MTFSPLQLGNYVYSSLIYGSSQGDVEEEVTVKNIYAGSIDVTLDSARFYRNELAKQQTLLTDVSSEGYYEGHPYAYGCYKIAANGVDYLLFCPLHHCGSSYGSFYFNELPCSELVCEDSCWCLPALAGL